MKRLSLIKNPELFQGKKYLKVTKNYFEGWYFKNTNGSDSISFIPGISINGIGKKAFIQVITNDSSYFVDYDIEDFVYHVDPFYIKIRNNYFSSKKVYVDIKDEQQGINIYGKLLYSDHERIHTTLMSPNIMGPFSYVPFMECHHAIISMKCCSKGFVTINGRKIDFDSGIGYIEKDWGSSFPKNYLWCQANCFKNEEASFMFSVAHIPFLLFSFRGMICVLLVGGKEYKFTTYNGAKLTQYEVNSDSVYFTLKKGIYWLSVKVFIRDGYQLLAPVKGEMSKGILETISSTVIVTLKKGNDIIFFDESGQCGLEIVSS